MQLLPNKGWATYELALRQLAENRGRPEAEVLAFLQELGLVDVERELTADGSRYFELRWIRCDQDAAKGQLARCLRRYAPVAIIIDMFRGAGTTSRDAIESVVRSRLSSSRVTTRTVGLLIGLLEHAGLVHYSKRTRLIAVTPDAIAESTPSAILVAPETPYANRLWLRRVIAECRDHVWWLDKHFLPAGLEELWEALRVKTDVRDVRILSLRTREVALATCLHDYRRLRAEFGNRGILLSWRLGDSAEWRDLHDRWIIGSNRARNLPNVNAVLSGQRSEILQSPHEIELRAVFLRLWAGGTRLDPAETTSVETAEVAAS